MRAGTDLSQSDEHYERPGAYQHDNDIIHAEKNQIFHTGLKNESKQAIVQITNSDHQHEEERNNNKINTHELIHHSTKPPKDFLSIHSNNPIELTSISPAQLKGRRVLVYCDFSSLRNHIQSNNNNDNSTNESLLSQSSLTSLLDSLPTLQYLIDANAHIIIVSGDISHHNQYKDIPYNGNNIPPRPSQPALSFSHIARSLTQLLGKQITFVKKPFENHSTALYKAIDQTDSQIILLENMSCLPPPKLAQNLSPMPRKVTVHDNYGTHGGNIVDELIGVVKPALIVHDSFSQNSLTNDLTNVLMTQTFQNNRIPTVAGLLVSKELDTVRDLLKIIHTKNVTKTLVLGNSSFSNLTPILQSSFDSTQNFIFGNVSALSLAHVGYITESSTQISTQCEQIKPSQDSIDPSTSQDVLNPNPLNPTCSIDSADGDMIGLEKTKAMKTLTMIDLSNAISFLSQSSRKNKSVWFPHDWNVVPDPVQTDNQHKPQHKRLSMTTPALYNNPDFITTDIGISSRKEFSHVIDGIIEKQLQGHQQLIFFTGTMSIEQNNNNNLTPISNPSNRGNDVIIESLNRATNAGVITIAGGVEVMGAIRMYQNRKNNSQPRELPKFSFLSSSPSTISALIAGTSVFGGLEQM